MLPALLRHRSGKDFGGVMKLRFGVFFWGAPSGVQTPSEAGYPSVFYEEFNGPVWSSFWGGPLGVLPRTKDRIFHGAFVACLHWHAIASVRQHESALSCIGLRCCQHVALAPHLFGFCRRESAPCRTLSRCFPPF